ncbi:MAG: TonB-dependent receptor [Proteiniphilum sp.]|uniref:TonB-dependent receptor n=1 Tax=Proteiniphilum sp. TaxID=1926877 RepID=UPI002B1FC47D|nr:TonB-dependent receptor [Proteiniphilum sp.]MEA5126675.1 TonB-dependent receptor [Proteiniphilum sp.]
MTKNKHLSLKKANIRRTCRIMRVFLLFLILGIGVCFSNNSYSQSTKISLNLKNKTVKQVFSEIEKNSEFIFFYQDDIIDVNRKVTVNTDNATIEQILNEILSATGNTYFISDRSIYIVKNVSDPVTDDMEQQQTRAITGKVTDEKGESIIGANIIEKGTTKGTVTDIDGNFQLSVTGDAVIQISYIGYLTEEIATAGKTTFYIVLREDPKNLEEVVVVGYGTVKRKDLTGSVASVAGSTLKDIPVTSAAQAIAGRLSGVQVTQSEGSPDADIKIRVRGGGSITQDNSPLYIVDGFPVDDINDIAPTDIESIDVLKDASSTAIYGARGANGVILVTTKGGSDSTDGKGKISYNMYFGIKEITNKLNVLNPYEYVFWQYELDQISPSTSTFEQYYGSFQDIDLYKQMTGIDWQERLFGRIATSSFHNLTFSGGKWGGSRYNISLTRNDNEEIMLGSGSVRTNLNVRTTNKINDWLSVDLNAMLSENKIKGAGTSANNRLGHIVQYRPVHGLSNYIDPDLVDPGDFEASALYNRNPIKQTEDDYRRSKGLTFNFNGAASIQLSKPLRYRFEYGNIFRETNRRNFYGLNTTNVNEYGGLPFARISETNSKRYRLANILTYTKRNIHSGGNLTAMLGQELVSEKNESITDVSRYFPQYIDAVSALSMMQLGTPDPTLTSDDPANKLVSFFGRLNYDYLGRYLASATFRADGSSKFAKGNRWGYFPSVALAWRINDEQFMLPTEEWLSDLKLRMSYGQSGNNRITDNAWQKTFSVSTGNIFMSGDESTRTPFLAPDGVLSNPKLRWETTETRNIGLDFGFFKQRLSGSVEVYKNITKDLLISATIPSSTGYTTQWQNIGQTSNKGLEIVLTGNIIDKKDFRLSASFNIAFNRNRIDKLGEAKEWEQISMWYGWVGTGTIAGDYLVKEGGQIGQMYGYVTDGMYSFDDFDYNPSATNWRQIYTLKEGVVSNQDLLGVGQTLFWPGALKFKNQNDDLVIDPDDRVIIGNANPKHTGGFNITTQYKGFDFSVFFNWVYGNDIYNANKIFFTSQPFGYRYRNLLGIMGSEDRFTYYNQQTGALVSDPTELAEMNKNAKLWFPGMNSLQLHSWAIEDGSFLRLNTLTIGYSFPPQLLNKLKLSQLRIFATGYNLCTWTNYSGFDPEVDMARRTPLTPGVDWGAYPRSRTYNMGINVEF